MSATHRGTVSDSYMELIRKFPLRRIKTAADHLQAKRIAVRLSIAESDRGVGEYLDILIDLIADYEKREGYAIDTSRVSAADLVRHRLEQREMSVSALARLIGVPQSNLSEMLSGKRGWSKASIRGLTSALNIRAEHFLV
jgi:antitoxin component HigA of HigAB toxin-antitoxin module